MLSRRLDFASPFDELRREVSRLIDGYGRLAGAVPFTYPAGFPAVNVWEDGDHVYAEAEVPGVSQDQLEVYTVGDELTIKGQRERRQDENLSWHRQERGSGAFIRAITLPVEVDADKVEATLKDGVLSITMPKAETARARRIAVQAN